MSIHPGNWVATLEYPTNDCVYSVLASRIKLLGFSWLREVVGLSRLSITRVSSDGGVYFSMTREPGRVLLFLDWLRNLDNHNEVAINKPPFILFFELLLIGIFVRLNILDNVCKNLFKNSSRRLVEFIKIKGEDTLYLRDERSVFNLLMLESGDNSIIIQHGGLFEDHVPFLGARYMLFEGDTYLESKFLEFGVDYFYLQGGQVDVIKFSASGPRCYLAANSSYLCDYKGYINHVVNVSLKYDLTIIIHPSDFRLRKYINQRSSGGVQKSLRTLVGVGSVYSVSLVHYDISTAIEMFGYDVPSVKHKVTYFLDIERYINEKGASICWRSKRSKNSI